VNRLGADNTWDVIVANPHWLPRQLANIQTSDGIETKNATPFVAGKHEANLIHVCREHNPQTFLSGGGATHLSDQNISESVNLNIISMSTHLFQYNRSNLAFVS
jgi:hypothetical protein